MRNYSVISVYYNTRLSTMLQLQYMQGMLGYMKIRKVPNTTLRLHKYDILGYNHVRKSDLKRFLDR